QARDRERPPAPYLQTRRRRPRCQNEEQRQHRKQVAISDVERAEQADSEINDYRNQKKDTIPPVFCAAYLSDAGGDQDQSWQGSLDRENHREEIPPSDGGILAEQKGWVAFGHSHSKLFEPREVIGHGNLDSALDLRACLQSIQRPEQDNDNCTTNGDHDPGLY